MRKKLSELTLEEFVRLLCEAEKVYEFEFKVYPIDKDKGFVYKGKYEQMCDFLKSVLADNPDDESTKGALEKLESDFFDYNLQLTKLDIYDYLEEKTKGFQADRCKILLDDMELQKFIIDDERDNVIDSKDDGLCAGYSMLDALSCLNYAYAVRILQEKMDMQTQQPYDKGNVLPDDILEDEERKYYERAIKCGFIKMVGGGFSWVYGGNVRLGYFCSKVYKTPRPINKLESRFNVKKLSASITQAEYNSKRDDVKRWRDEIDKMIFFD